MNDPINYAAVRAFNRIWSPIGARLRMAEEADAGFDAGEFSGAYHHEVQGDEWGRVIRVVAASYGIPTNVLENDLARYDAENFEEYYKRTVLGQ